jgi:polysaccharide biosynthesis transport protein
MNLAIGLLLGFGFGVGIIFLKEALTTKIRTPEDIKKENIVNLTTIASMYGEVKQISKRGWYTVRGRVISGFIITVTNPLSPVSEAFRALRTNIQYSQIDKPVQTLVVTSPNPGEGKSTVAVNLAVTYAQGEKKVLIVDADLRKPMLHNGLDLKKKPGLTNILFENVELAKGIQPTVVDNLYAISCGDIVGNPADLLGSQKMKKLIETLKTNFDIIIFDTPPMFAATDASVLCTVSDGVIIVTASRSTKVDDLRVSVESISNVHGRVLGTVLNKFDHRDGYGSKYTQQYYQYGSYGKPTNGNRKKRVLS